MAKGHLLLITALDQRNHFRPGLLAPDLYPSLFPPQQPEGTSEHPSQILPLVFPSLFSHSSHQGVPVSQATSRLSEPSLAPTSL